MSSRRNGRRRALRVAGVVAAALGSLLIIWVLLGFLLQRYALFPREFLEPEPRAGEGIEGLERVWIDTDEGRVEAWFLPGDGTDSRPGPAVMFAHGNGELIDGWPRHLRPYRRMGISVMLAEYRGYGRSAGDPTQDAIVSDYVEFYDWLTRDSRVAADHIVFHGRSLGGGVVAALAREREPAALILESTFTSVRAMAHRFYQPGFIVRDPFDTLDTLEHHPGPVLILHGTEDTLIPLSHAEALHRAATRSTLETRSCGHNDCPRDAFYWETIRLFLSESGVKTKKEGSSILDPSSPDSVSERILGPGAPRLLP